MKSYTIQTVISWTHLTEDRKKHYASHWSHLSQIWEKHDDVIKWKHFARYWPFVWGIHWSPVNSPYKSQWRGNLMFFELRPIQQLNKHWRRRWFETSSRSLWRHCNYTWNILREVINKNKVRKTQEQFKLSDGSIPSNKLIISKINQRILH